MVETPKKKNIRATEKIANYLKDRLLKRRLDLEKLEKNILPTLEREGIFEDDLLQITIVSKDKKSITVFETEEDFHRWLGLVKKNTDPEAVPPEEFWRNFISSRK